MTACIAGAAALAGLWLFGVIGRPAVASRPEEPYNQTSFYLGDFFFNCTGAPLDIDLVGKMNDEVDAVLQAERRTYAANLTIPQLTMDQLHCPDQNGMAAADYALEVVKSYLRQLAALINNQIGSTTYKVSPVPSRPADQGPVTQHRSLEALTAAAPALRDAMGALVVMTMLHGLGLL